MDEKIVRQPNKLFRYETIKHKRTVGGVEEVNRLRSDRKFQDEKVREKVLRNGLVHQIKLTDSKFGDTGRHQLHKHQKI